MQLLSYQKLTWYNLLGPTPEELSELEKKYQFHELDIEDCLSEHERPKVDEYEKYLFLVLHIPYYQKESRRIVKEEVHIFIGENYLMTLHDGKLEVLNAFWERLQSSEKDRHAYMGEGSGYFLYEIIDLLFGSCFPLVDGINRELRKLEGILFEEEKEDRVLRVILELKRSIISMRRILLPQRTLIAALEHKSKKFIDAELDVYFDDVLDAIERQWSLLETSKEVIEALQDSHETWIQNRTNRVIRVLTIFSVTMLPLTVITGFFGMNVSLPLAGNPHAFIAISVVLFISLIGALAYFAWKRWL
jgi:magnesium transporter